MFVTSASPLESRPRWQQFSLRSMLIAVAVISMILSLTCYIIRRNAEFSERSSAIDAVESGLAAIEAYATPLHRLPAWQRKDREGNPLSSWRFNVAPHALPSGIYADLKLPWDHEDNIWLSRERIYPFCFGPCKDNGEERFWTNVQAIVGPGTAFGDEKPVRYSELDDDTILIVEVRNSGVNWMAPGDLEVQDIPHLLLKSRDAKGLGTVESGFCVGFADGEVWFLRADIPFASLRKFLMVEESKKYDREKVLGPYRL